MKVDGGGGVGVAGKIARSFDGASDGAGDGAGDGASEDSNARTLVNENGGGDEPPLELLWEVVGLVSSVGRSA